MQLLLFQKKESELLRWLVTRSPCKQSSLAALMSRGVPNKSLTGVLIPQTWSVSEMAGVSSTFSYEEDDECWRLPPDISKHVHENVFVSCARTAVHIHRDRLRELLEMSDADVLTITVDSELNASGEVVRLTSQRHVVGFRRYYELSVEPGPQPPQWPAITCFKSRAWKTVVNHGSMMLGFPEQLNLLSSMQLKIEHFRIGGELCRLDTDKGILSFIREWMAPDESSMHTNTSQNGYTVTGPVWLGEDIHIEPDVKIVGPAVIADGVKVGSGAIIRQSILGPQVAVSEGEIVNQCIYSEECSKQVQPEGRIHISQLYLSENNEEQGKFRHWSFFSYPHFLKRIFDILISAFVLILLIPLFPVFIALVKWKSPGPIFYRARRQGLHGREFGCLKFRTMIVQAEDMQQQLRALNQVDGPQFKMDNDPRVSAAGKFLRDTCIDELPQFINVLLGQMSIVGPRPSPEHENESRPMWRDARLSVRPGITGPWQIFRTRQPSMDFQEWVYYDTRYVRNMSFWQDVYICLKTAQKLTNNLLDQFG